MFDTDQIDQVIVEPDVNGTAPAHDETYGQEAPNPIPSAADLTNDQVDEPTAQPESQESPESAVAPNPKTARNPQRHTGLLIMMALFMVAVPVLGFLGYRSVDNNTRGQLLSGRAQSTDPGYQALLEPTATALLILTDENDNPISLTILTLSGPGGNGGSVVNVPLDARLLETAYGQRTFGEVASNVTTKTAGNVIGAQLSLSFTEVVKLDTSMLATMMIPVGSIEIVNPQQVTAADGTVFAEGRIELEPGQVALYLGAQSESGTPQDKSKRSELVWSAWLSKVHSSRDVRGIVPGEANVGLGRFVRGLAEGSVSYGSLPVTEAAPIDEHPTYKVNANLARLMLTNAIPFPVAGGDGRLMVRVLNGTGAGPIPQSIMQRLVFAGAQVTVVGNNASFDVKETTFRYSSPANKSKVQAMAKILGAGKVELRPEAEGGADVTVVLGSDVMESPPALLTPSEIEP